MCNPGKGKRAMMRRVMPWLFGTILLLLIAVGSFSSALCFGEASPFKPIIEGRFPPFGRRLTMHELIRRDTKLLSDCIDCVLAGKDVDSQVERFEKNHSKHVYWGGFHPEELIRLFGDANQEFMKVYKDYSKAWENSAGLAMDSRNWDSDHDERSWYDLIAEAKKVQGDFRRNISEFANKYVEKLSEMDFGLQDLQNGREMKLGTIGFFLKNRSLEAKWLRELFGLRNDQLNGLQELATIYKENERKIKEEDDVLVFNDEKLNDMAQSIFDRLYDDEKKIIDLLAK